MIEFKLVGLDTMAVPVKNLRAIGDPLLTPPWGDRCGRPIAQICIDEVESAIAKGDISPVHWAKNWSFSRGQHIARIAALVVDPDATPIEVDLGFPGHGYFPPWPIFDGNHRFCAAIVRCDQFIVANLRGDAEHIEGGLGIVPRIRVVT
ncbi:hypothetical protein JQ557_00825 [Bradyrhizobium sp. U87765 SZCCT0131]|uniref:hypothetical protein n=1 Tax=unclassified Bradyrhizobium TaxID=2631580 RepID=UPI001BABB624|nr:MULTISPECIES: hypothetical protein [unclassified Bradyrhizobium]MBR1216515.1 hypothetical protein [Bradyrhizobium sp. U87765 SZCCT0131]MBR1259729.1 hypothetical protein [Bradyrhizobium sp. U87765 SZCCT0134]MBR1305870.1 hypothetical protein [Bradyrhizobium sp. U87765 SZCCT0110]MBR1322237.1 hypothetical protein [Bradyrhizobium sp. U87765 SZCCT0109]MBR1350484.1 hypothetical protein [Bradyrhizobium sp. U87765 SZCCT0048]